MEQEKIDVTRATPVTDARATESARRGAPLWLQILLSLIVIAAAVAGAALFSATANDMVKRVGLSLPLLNAPAEAQAQSGAPAGRPQGGGGAGGRAGGGGFANRSAIVVTQPVTSGTINNKLSAIGESSAVHSVTVSSASGGTLMSVDVKPGDTVDAGARIATLDSATQQNAYDKARLAAEDADAALARAKALAASSNLSKSQVDAAQLAADNARLAVQAAQITLDQRSIVTPVAGTVGLIQVTPGNLIGANTAITSIEDSSEILINFWVPERYSSQIAVGTPVAANSAALPGRNFEGAVSAVDNKIDPASRTLQVQATLPNPDAVIKSGMSFTVDLSFPGQTFAAVDPLSIQWSNDGAYVWKVVDSRAVKGMVDIIQRNSDGVLVKGDVKPGDAVVTQGVLQLSDNMTVRLLDQVAAGNAAGQANGAPGQRQQGAPAQGAAPGQAAPAAQGAAPDQAKSAAPGQGRAGRKPSASAAATSSANG